MNSICIGATMSVTFLGAAAPFPRLHMPLFLDVVIAGFPSPAQDFIERTLDLNELCIQKPAATFFVRAQGDSMIDAGIFPGDILVVDRSLQAEHGDIVIAGFNAELTVKKLQLRPHPRLLAMNPAYPPIDIPEETELEIFGVVIHVIHSLKRS